MKNPLLALAVSLLALASLHAAEVADLRCEFRKDPLAIDAARPGLSWKLETGNLKLNGAPVYGAKPVSFNIPGTPTQASLKHKAEVEARFAKLNKPAPLTPLERTYPWIATRNGNSIYLTIFKWPAENQLTIERVKQQIQGICLSSTTDQPVEFTHKCDRLAITLPAKPTGDLPPVLCLSLAVDQPQ
jgi:hypothetical protein